MNAHPSSLSDREPQSATYEGRAFIEGRWLPWHPISVEVYENRQKWPREGYEVRATTQAK